MSRVQAARMRVWFAGLLVGVLGACDSSTEVATMDPVTEVAMAYDSVALQPGNVFQLAATPRNGQGRPLAGVAVEWQSSDPEVATVSSTGLVTAVSPGMTFVEASARGKKGATKVRVSASGNATPTLIGISPNAAVAGSGSATISVQGSGFVSTSVVQWNGADRQTTFVSATELRAAITAGDLANTGTARVRVVTPGPGGGTTTELPFMITAVPTPGAVGDLVVTGVTQTTLTVRWTQVDDGTGAPARYALQYGSPTITWSNAAASMVLLNGTATGAALSHTFEGLSASTQYQVQLVAYRGTSAADAIMGPLSNVATGSTAAPAGPGPVRRLEVTPSTYSFTQAGQTTQLTAVARDSAGTIVPGINVTWTSTNPAIVTVSSSGLMSSVAAGTAQVIASATCCGVSDTVAVTVNSQSPPPPSGTELYRDDFEAYGAGSSLAGRGSNGFTWGSPLYAQVSSDLAHSGNRSLKFFYGPTEPNGASHWWSEQEFNHPRMKEYWVEYYIYFPSGNEGVGSARYVHNANGMNNKFFTYWGPGYSDAPAGNASMWGSGESSTVGFINVGGAWSGSNPGPLVASNADRGRWMQIRIHVKVPDFGVSNGVLELWKDGVMITARRNEPSRVSSDANNYLSHGYLLGYDNAQFTQNTWIYIDDFRMLTSNPGW